MHGRPRGADPGHKSSTVRCLRIKRFGEGRVEDVEQEDDDDDYDDSDDVFADRSQDEDTVSDISTPDASDLIDKRLDPISLSA